MSSKGTIFLTSENEHVYEECNDWSIGFEINYKSLVCVVIVEYKDYEKVFKLLDITDEYGKLYVETRSRYQFVDSFKADNGNTPDCIIFKDHEIKEISTHNEDIAIPAEIRIYVKISSEWHKKYLKHLHSCIMWELEKGKEKLEIVSAWLNVGNTNNE